MNKCPNCGTTSEEVKCATCNVDMVKSEGAVAEPTETKEAAEVTIVADGVSPKKEGEIAA
jgi:hypothetical protein